MKDMGFDILEISVENPALVDVAAGKAKLGEKPAADRSFAERLDPTAIFAARNPDIVKMPGSISAG